MRLHLLIILILIFGCTDQQMIENKEKIVELKPSDLHPLPSTIKIELGESTIINRQVYSFCDYFHKGKTIIAFCNEKNKSKGFHALIGQSIKVGKDSVLVKKLVPRDNVKGVPEVSYIEVGISSK